MTQRQSSGKQADDKNGKRKTENGKCFFILFIPVNLFFDFLCAENFPKPLQNNQRQRHSHKQTSLRDEKRDERIPPAKILADGVIARQIVNKIYKTLFLPQKIFRKPEKT